MSDNALSVLSYGGGVQSTAILVLHAQYQIRLDAVIHCDLLDAESPDTRAYVQSVAMPYAASIGLPFHIVQYDLIASIRDNPSFPHIPFRDASGSLRLKRQCTNHAKIRPFRRMAKHLMKQHRYRRVDAVIGISVDEYHRMRETGMKWIRNVYPLVDMRLTRNDCISLIQSVGLPLPRKSSCWFCPYRRASEIYDLLDRYPHLRDMAISLQHEIDSARYAQGKDRLMVIPAIDARHIDCVDGHCLT